jgi:lipopolysaccharide/colanic/teichoic acid biosynthesis glycosyltransferase
MRSAFYQRYGKRAFDVFFGVGLLALLAPALALIALAIKASSQGPVFYTQERMGKDGRPFRFIKFRTMIVGAEKTGAGVLCLPNDPRVTLVGRWLRRFSLDELPQLVNVVRGEMSVIGPRPGLAYQVEKYTPEQRRRLMVLPGITGLAQVNGRNSLTWDQRIQYDVEYVDRLSPWLDCLILCRTVRSVLAGGDLLAAKDYFKEQALDTRKRGAELVTESHNAKRSSRV